MRADDGVWGASERKTYVRPCRATCRGVSPFCDIHLQQESTRPAWGLAAVVELRSCATVPQLLVWPGLHRFSVRLLPRPHDVQRAAEGVQVIVHAVNPPGYRNWGGLVLPMTDNSIAAARRQARVAARDVPTVLRRGPAGGEG
jgi:hypothetical protein